MLFSTGVQEPPRRPILGKLQIFCATSLGSWGGGFSSGYVQPFSTSQRHIQTLIHNNAVFDPAHFVKHLRLCLSRFESLGIEHRDIKPQNMGMSLTGVPQPLIFDFGFSEILSWMVNPSDGRTTTTAVLRESLKLGGTVGFRDLGKNLVRREWARQTALRNGRHHPLMDLFGFSFTVFRLFSSDEGSLFLDCYAAVMDPRGSYGCPAGRNPLGTKNRLRRTMNRAKNRVSADPALPILFDVGEVVRNRNLASRTAGTVERNENTFANERGIMVSGDVFALRVSQLGKYKYMERMDVAEKVKEIMMTVFSPLLFSDWRLRAPRPTDVTTLPACPEDFTRAESSRTGPYSSVQALPYDPRLQAMELTNEEEITREEQLGKLFGKVCRAVAHAGLLPELDVAREAWEQAPLSTAGYLYYHMQRRYVSGSGTSL
ncbi:unnamed protein product [Amoebophrya sp. A120]|nr:unnamed protein product [Amoebophrya sp. A120]|eukprot:GSA120T00020501001.1